MMAFLVMLLVGLFVGALAKLVVPGKDPGGMLITSLLGIAGALLAGLIGRAVGWYNTPAQAPGIIASTLGAVIILVIYHSMRPGRR